MSFWSALAKPFKFIGHVFVDIFDDLPKIIAAIPKVQAEVPTLVADIGSLLKAVGALALLCVNDAKPLIAALAAFIAAVVAAGSQAFSNLSEDEAALTAAEAMYTAIKTDVSGAAQGFLAALDAVVTAYDNTAATIQTALSIVEQAVE